MFGNSHPSLIIKPISVSTGTHTSQPLSLSSADLHHLTPPLSSYLSPLAVDLLESNTHLLFPSCPLMFPNPSELIVLSDDELEGHAIPDDVIPDDVIPDDVIPDDVIPDDDGLDVIPEQCTPVQVCEETMNVLDVSGYSDAILDQRHRIKVISSVSLAGETDINLQPSGPIIDQPIVSMDMERSVNPVTPRQSHFSVLTYMKRILSEGAEPAQVREDLLSMGRVSQLQVSSVVSLSEKTVSPNDTSEESSIEAQLGSNNDDTSVVEMQSDCSQTPQEMEDDQSESLDQDDPLRFLYPLIETAVASTVTSSYYLCPVKSNSNSTTPSHSSPQSSAVDSSSDQTFTTPESLRKRFQPTTILLKDQILGYKQVYVTPDPIVQAIKKIKICPICGCSINFSQTKSPLKLQEVIVEHLRATHNLPVSQCKTCKKTSIPEYNIPCICRTCDVCLRPFNMGLKFLNHVRKEHIQLTPGTPSVPPGAPAQPGNTFHCLVSSKCSFSCHTDAIFAKHLADAHHVVTQRDPHNPDNLIIKCPLCSFKKGSLNGLTAHIKKFHFALGTNKYMRDRKHKTIFSSIFMFNENSCDVPSTDAVVSGNVADDSENEVLDVG